MATGRAVVISPTPERLRLRIEARDALDRMTAGDPAPFLRRLWTSFLREFAVELKPYLDEIDSSGPPVSGPITFTIRQDPFTMALTVRPNFQPPSMSDVAFQRLRYSVNDGPEVVNDVPIADAGAFTLDFDHDDRLVGHYSQVDRFGNESPSPIPFDVTIKDTFGPPVEGEFGFTVTGQTEDTPPEPEPTPDVPMPPVDDPDATPPA